MDETVTSESVLGDALARLVGRRGVRHAALAVESGDGALKHAGAAGEAVPGGPPMRPDTPFHYASVTKLFTATAVMQLWEEGSLGLDDPITAYLPLETTDSLHRLDGVDRSDQITVRHLLAHTSGLPDYFLGTPEGGVSFAVEIVEGDFSFTIDDVVARVRRMTPHFPPQDPGSARQRARYSDTNFQLLGAVVEAVTAQPFHQAVESRILDPFGLADTWFAGHPRGERSTPAAMWSDDTVLDAPMAMASIAPEGGLIGTAGDAITFMRALMSGALFQREGTLAQMQARWNRFGFPRDRTAIMAPGWPVEYGLGIKRFQMPRLFNGGRRAPVLLGHTGASGSWLFFSPEHDLYLSGTLDQTRAAPVPYRMLPKLVRSLTG